jgi:hypothetical protein
MNGSGGAFQHVPNHGQVLWRRICRGNEPRHHLLARGEHQHAADDLIDRVQPQAESGDDTEVAAAAAERPEEIGIRVLVHREMLPVGGHHFSREHVIDGQAVLADEKAEAAAEREPTEADARSVAEPGRPAAFAGHPTVVACLHAGLRPCGPAVRVHFDSVHPREIEDDAAVGRAVPRPAVAAAPHGELCPGLTCQRDDPRDVRCVGGADDHPGPAVEARKKHSARVVVTGIVRANHVALQAGAEVRDLDVGFGLQRVLLPFT